MKKGVNNFRNKEEEKRQFFSGINSINLNLMGFHIYLNIYDMSSCNIFLKCFGLEIFHTGVEIGRNEYFYCYNEEKNYGI